MGMGAIQRWYRVPLVFALLAAVLNPQPIIAQAHVVSHGDLRAALQSAAHTREQNRATVAALLNTPQAVKVLKAVQVDTDAVRTAVSSLTDEELARLAARAEKVQNDVVAGRLSDRDLLLLVLGIAALILIIVAVR
jgi:hypothetical protein